MLPLLYRLVRLAHGKAGQIPRSSLLHRPSVAGRLVLGASFWPPVTGRQPLPLAAYRLLLAANSPTSGRLLLTTHYCLPVPRLLALAACTLATSTGRLATQYQPRIAGRLLMATYSCPHSADRLLLDGMPDGRGDGLWPTSHKRSQHKRFQPLAILHKCKQVWRCWGGHGMRHANGERSHSAIV